MCNQVQFQGKLFYCGSFSLFFCSKGRQNAQMFCDTKLYEKSKLYLLNEIYNELLNTLFKNASEQRFVIITNV